MSLIARLWGEGSGFVAAQTPTGLRQRHCVSAAEANDLAIRLAPGADVYMSVGSFPGQRRAQSENPMLRALFLDLDCGPGAPYPAKEPALHALLAWCGTTGFPPPSALVDSGGGLHVYWFLDRGYPATEWSPFAVKLKNALIAANVRADHCCTADSARVLRVPGTWNRKQAEPRPVRYKLLSGAEHALSALDEILRGGAKEGGRNNHVFRLACSLLARGFSRSEARGLVLEEAKNCTPALSELEAERCLASAQKYHSDPNAGALASEPGTPWPIARLGLFSIDETGVWYSGKAPDADADAGVGAKPGRFRVCTVPVWLETVLGHASEAKHQARICFQPPHGPAVHAVVDAGELSVSGVALRKALGDIGLGFFVPNARGYTLMGSYISELSRERLQSSVVDRFYPGWGWHDDGYVLGGNLFVAGSAPRPVHVSTPFNPLSRAPGARAVGSLDSQCTALALLGAQGEAYQAAALLGLGAPMLGASGRQGVVVSLAGRAGTGKTLLANTVLAVFARPTDLMLAGKATLNALDTALGSARHMPIAWDDNSGSRIEDRAQFFYDVANGAGKSRNSKMLQVKSTPTWGLCAYVTSNYSALESSVRSVNEAQRRRAIEITFDTVFDPDVGRRIADMNRTNYGCVGEKYIQFLVDNRGRLEPAMLAAEETVRSWSTVPSESRHGIWAISAALVAGQILCRLGLVNWRTDAACHWLTRQLHTQAQEIPVECDTILLALRDFMTENAGAMVIWLESTRMPAERMPPRVVGRVLSDRIALHLAALQPYLEARRISRAGLESFLRNTGGKRANFRLSPLLPSTRCVVMSRSILDPDTGG